MTARGRYLPAWIPSEPAWQAAESKYRADYNVRREYVPIGKFDARREKHGPGNERRYSYDSFVFSPNTPPILVGYRRGVYSIVDGTHRFQAARLRRLREVPCVVVDGMMASK